MKFIYSYVFYIIIILSCIILKTHSIIQSRTNSINGIINTNNNNNNNNKFHYHYNNNNQTIIQTNNPKHSLFTTYFSLQKHCQSIPCEFCCINTTKCGTKTQCETAYNFLFIINIFFISLCIILTLTLIIKCCFMINSLPEQLQRHKLTSNNLKDILQIYNILSTHKHKFIYHSKLKSK